MARTIGICPWNYISVYGQKEDSNFKICKRIMVNQQNFSWNRIIVYNKDTKEDVDFPLTNVYGNIYEINKYLDVYGLKGMENARYEDGFLYFNGKMKYQNHPNVNNPIDANTYVGEFKNRTRHGKGILSYNNGDEYTGEFKDDNADGLGKMIYANGNIYIGAWLEGKQDGDGKMFYKNGDIYDGDWLKGKRHGQGKMVFSPLLPNVVATPSLWWVENLRRERDSLMPKFVKPEHDEATSTYEGEWKDDKLNGSGTMIFANATGKYQGNFKDNVRDGKGTMIYSNGEQYDGQWSKGKRNGKVILTFANLHDDEGRIISYEGNFKDNVRDGEGTLLYENGVKFIGLFKDNVRDGEGIMTYTNGDTYKGEWKNNEMINGRGIMLNASKGTKSRRVKRIRKSRRVKRINKSIKKNLI